MIGPQPRPPSRLHPLARRILDLLSPKALDSGTGTPGARAGIGGTLESLVERLAEQPLDFHPGTHWSYTVSTDICGRLVEILSGRRFDEYLRDEVFVPLGMVDTGFFVPDDAWGLDVETFEVMAPHPIGDVIFKDCQIPRAFLLGEEGEGLELALSVLARFRTSVAAAANGFARRALDESCSHLATRRQFGKPLAKNQALRFDLAEMDVRLRAAELLVDEAAAAVDRGQEAQAAVARAKLYATESASWIADRAVQHLGGLGVRRGEPVERVFREVRALRIYEGTSEVQKLILARELVGS